MAKKQGRKPKYNERTTTIAFRVPESKVHALKRVVQIYLNQFKTYKNEKYNK